MNKYENIGDLIVKNDHFKTTVGRGIDLERLTAELKTFLIKKISKNIMLFI